MIDISSYRMRIGLHYHRHHRIKGLNLLSVFELLIVLSLLLLKSGDIETNPGPVSEQSFSSVSSTMSLNESMIKNKFSLVHYNVQSLLNKKDILFSELSSFDIISLTETWLDQRTPDNDIEFNGYKTYRRDRVGDSHGGVCVYVNDNLYSKRRHDLEVPNVECIWIEVISHSKKI